MVKKKVAMQVQSFRGRESEDERSLLVEFSTSNSIQILENLLEEAKRKKLRLIDGRA